MILPPSYVSNHVALGYALTIHKAQGATTTRAIVLVDEQTTRPQLYVAMTHGREENRVLVVTEQRQDEHELARQTPPLEVLESILRHQGADRSAHDVLRASLARLEDRSLLRDLVHEAQRRVDELAGPDRSAEIAALTGCADVEAAEERLRAAEIAVKRAEKEHRSNTRIWNELHHARFGVSKAHEARGELDALTVYQDRRATWIEEHPGEVGWVNELETRLSESEDAYRLLIAEQESTRESRTVLGGGRERGHCGIEDRPARTADLRGGVERGTEPRRLRRGPADASTDSRTGRVDPHSLTSRCSA